jgi:hypothetical protein
MKLAGNVGLPALEELPVYVEQQSNIWGTKITSVVEEEAKIKQM